MKKRILSLIICLMFAFSLNIAVSANDTEFQITPLIDYDNEKITITGVTPATYAQNVSVVIYALSTPISGMGDVEDRNHPEPQFPLDVTNIKKIKNVTADLEGNFKVEFKLADLEAGYYMVSASGGGYKKAVSKDSELIYFENVNSINTVTIPAFNAATKDTVEPLIREKELLVGVDVAGDYEDNKEIINTLYETVKTDDYPDGYSAGEMYKIQDTFSAITLLREMYATESAADMVELIAEYEDILGVDTNHEDYKNNKEEVARIFLNIIKEGKDAGEYVPRSMLDSRRVFTQSMGVVKLNGSDNEGVGAILETYGEILGLDMDAYNDACEEYTATEVNKAFVEREFKLPSKVTDAYDEGIAVLEEKASASSGGSGGGGGGGGGLGGGRPSQSKEDYITIDKEIIEENLPEEEVPQKFSDVEKDHWAYEAVQTLAEIGIIDGFEDGTFAPDSIVTREQFVKMLIVAGNYHNGELKAEFSDVAADRWSSSYIASAVSRGIVKGSGDGTFSPGASLTRQDASVMAYRLANVMKKPVSKSDTLSFTDSDKVAEYAVEAVATLESSKIINGFEDGSFSPMGTLTRAQAAKIIYGIVIK